MRETEHAERRLVSLFCETNPMGAVPLVSASGGPECPARGGRCQTNGAPGAGSWIREFSERLLQDCHNRVC